ncbi:conserved hypothetical protein [Hyphomicrobiales bacterium]|nr:conserved hypothetical protein [Hyphomicrobiales bacterium]CAH1667218.1 conserved hypothetical protein [Hyphomicrobiales bacterium]
MATIISVTEKASGHRVLINADHILMVRPISHGGCNVYLDSASIHAPDILTVADDLDELLRRWNGDDRMRGEPVVEPVHTPH